MAILSVAGMHPRSLTVKLIGLGSAFTLLYILYSYTFSSSPFKMFSRPHFDGPSCSPKDYSAGSWQYHPRTNATSLTSKDDALAFSGFQGCASSREYYWHLATDTEQQFDRFPKAHSYEWVPGNKCKGFEPLDPAALIRELVEEGGWLLVGDSVTENHFFSLSCILYPHVLGSPDYVANPYFDRAWPQYLHLNPASPLVSTLSFPPGFNITLTPLVMFRRIDLLLSVDEISAVHAKMPKSFALAENTTLFSDEAVWTLPVSEYLDIFTAPLPTANYATMVVSTAGHWTTTVFAGFRDEERKEAGYGLDKVLSLFRNSMELWAKDVQAHLWREARGAGVVKGDRNGVGKRQVVVRAYLPGHEDCHNQHDPYDEVKPMVWNWYNWGQIWEFNNIFDKLLSSKAKYPDIHYVGIDRPALLRPDAHATGDCLHIMTGAGVLEGWSHYIWHFISKEIRPSPLRQ